MTSNDRERRPADRSSRRLRALLGRVRNGLLGIPTVRPLDAAASEPAALASGESPEASVRCVLALGAALLGYGLPAHRIEEAIVRLQRAFGMSGTVFGLPTTLMITVRGPHGSHTYTVRAEPGSIDLQRLDALHELVARVERGGLDAAGAELRVAAILRAPRRLPRWTELLAVMLVASGGALMLGGNHWDAAWSAALGLSTGAMLWVGSMSSAFSRVLPVCTALLVTFTSCALSHLGTLEHPVVAAFAALLVLLPGLTLTLAMTELATGHMVSGTARGVSAATVFLQLGFGVLLGLRLGRLDEAALSALPPAPFAEAACGALLLAVGFMALFAVRTRDIPHTLAISALSFLLCRAAGAVLGPEIGVLIAACAVGLASHTFARLRNRPSSTLTLPGVTMLVPGSLGLLSVSAAALHDPSRAFDLGFGMLMVVIALSTGILLAAAALPPRSSF